MEGCITPLTFIIVAPLIFGCGVLAGRQQGSDKCSERVKQLLSQKGFKYDDENNGDA